jgi:hypothetical protein
MEFAPQWPYEHGVSGEQTRKRLRPKLHKQRGSAAAQTPHCVGWYMRLPLFSPKRAQCFARCCWAGAEAVCGYCGFFQRHGLSLLLAKRAQCFARCCWAGGAAIKAAMCRKMYGNSALFIIFEFLAANLTGKCKIADHASGILDIQKPLT